MQLLRGPAQELDLAMSQSKRLTGLQGSMTGAVVRIRPGEEKHADHRNERTQDRPETWDLGVDAHNPADGEDQIGKERRERQHKRCVRSRLSAAEYHLGMLLQRCDDNRSEQHFSRHGAAELGSTRRVVVW